MFKKLITPKTAKYFLWFYPPFFFNRIVVQNVSEDFTEVDVKIVKSFWNNNIAKTIFGGTMFSAADPFIAIMYWQIFDLKYKIPLIVWLKSAEIIYKKPATSNLYLKFRITEEEILATKKTLETKRKCVVTHQVNLINKKEEICAVVNLKSYLAMKP